MGRVVSIRIIRPIQPCKASQDMSNEFRFDDYLNGDCRSNGDIDLRQSNRSRWHFLSPEVIRAQPVRQSMPFVSEQSAPVRELPIRRLVLLAPAEESDPTAVIELFQLLQGSEQPISLELQAA